MITRTVVVAGAIFIGALAGVTVDAQQHAKPVAAVRPDRAAIKPLASIKELMQALSIPMSEAVFKAGADAPKDDAGWAQLRKHALALAETANLLLMDGRAPDTGDWTRLALAQRDAAMTAVKAIDAHDGDALSNASDALYETCDNCHNKYMKK